MPRPSLSSFLRLMDVRTIASPIKQSPTPSPLTMAGPAQDKGRPDTSGHKRPSVKKNREGCFMGRRIFWSKTGPSHPQLLSGNGEKMWDFRNGSRFNGLSPHLEKSHYSWNFLLLKESLPSYVFIFRNWHSRRVQGKDYRQLNFHPKFWEKKIWSLTNKNGVSYENAN